MRKTKKQYKPITRREVTTNSLGYTMIADPIEALAPPEPKSKECINPITAARQRRAGAGGGAATQTGISYQNRVAASHSAPFAT
jgi:hypothetical protein